MNKFTTIINELYKRDVTKEGESNKLVCVLRVIETAVIFYCIICLAYDLANGYTGIAKSHTAVMVLYLILFHASFKKSARFQVIGINLVALFTVAGGCCLYGADTRIYTFFVVLIMLDFFSTYGYYKQKALFAILITLVYVLITIIDPHLSQYSASTIANSKFFQVMDVLLAVICTAYMSYIYSRDSQHLEGKLLEYNSLLRKQASTDALTGLCNRRSALEFIEKQIRKAGEGSNFCVCMCDIDFFKKVNDTYGHDIGDKVLRGMASAMKENLPDGTLISRWGGEEFLVVFPDMNGDEAKMSLDILRSKVKKLEFDVCENKRFSITVTYGLAEYGYNGDAHMVVKEADEKLYYGKENGRDQVVF